MPKSRRRPSGTAITGCVRDITSANKAAATHAAQHAKGGADPITPERIGAAPGGYGIGETPKYIADANDAVKNGRYAVDKSTLNLPGPIGDLWHYTYLDVYTGNRPDVYIKQTMTSPYQSWHQCEVTRCFYDSRGGWQPWEWVNPPMLPGVEYRTTERYLGKPVYVKTVDFGALPNASYKFVGIENEASIIRVSALASNGKTLPGSIGASQREQVLCMGSSNSVEIITYADASSLTATVTAWYTKATD